MRVYGVNRGSWGSSGSQYPEKEFLLRVSYLEIYNETVTDLLVDSWKRKPLEVREALNKNVGGSSAVLGPQGREKPALWEDKDERAEQSLSNHLQNDLGES